MVRGEEDFVSIDQGFRMRLGSNVITNEHWDSTTHPLNMRSIPKYQQKILSKLGFDRKAYRVAFSTSFDSPFKLIALVNTSTDVDSLIDLSKLKIHVGNDGKWFDEQKKIGDKYVYHAVVPISEKLLAPKYLSMVFLTDNPATNTETIQEIVKTNSILYREGLSFHTSKTELDCDDASSYYDYELPYTIVRKKEHALLIVRQVNNPNSLVYYSVLQPTIRVGSFMLCKGAYLLEYTTLDNHVLWSDTIVVK